MARQRCCQSADFASAHGIGLTSDAEGTSTFRTDASGQQMAIDNRICLISASAGLIGALAEKRYATRGFSKPMAECCNCLGR